MKYYYKIFRTTGDAGRVLVQPVLIAPENIRPAAARYDAGTVETVRVFRTRAAAERANAADRLAAELQNAPAEVRREKLRAALKSVANFGLSTRYVAKCAQCSPVTLQAWASGKNPPTGRGVAAVILLERGLKALIKDVQDRLPPVGGNPNKYRGGNPNIGRYAQNQKKVEKDT